MNSVVIYVAVAGFFFAGAGLFCRSRTLAQTVLANKVLEPELVKFLASVDVARVRVLILAVFCYDSELLLDCLIQPWRTSY